ncbi:MAG TPA: 4-alpha-glucanotransferase, partial [Granulicella sp.]|nr:4-alpha-glucanotransferase [Granulicella sp.]
NTTLGWWRDGATEAEREHVQSYLQPIRHEGEIVWAMIRAAARSVANLCIFPLQDVLHLGSEARMNTPSAPAGNWTWRYGPDALHRDFATQLAALMEMTDRDGYAAAKEGEDAGKPTEEAAERMELGSRV